VLPEEDPVLPEEEPDDVVGPELELLEHAAVPMVAADVPMPTTTMT